MCTYTTGIVGTKIICTLSCMMCTYNTYDIVCFLGHTISYTMCIFLDVRYRTSVLWYRKSDVRYHSTYYNAGTILTVTSHVRYRTLELGRTMSYVAGIQMVEQWNSGTKAKNRGATNRGMALNCLVHGWVTQWTVQVISPAAAASAGSDVDRAADRTSQRVNRDRWIAGAKHRPKNPSKATLLKTSTIKLYNFILMAHLMTTKIAQQGVSQC